MKIITAMGDSIVDTVGRSSVTDTTQWLYKLMQKMGETSIKLEPLPGFSATPNVLPLLSNRITNFTYKNLADKDLTNFQTYTDETIILPFNSIYTTGAAFFAIRAYTKDTAFHLKVSVSADNLTWYDVSASIDKPADHLEGWSFCNWNYEVYNSSGALLAVKYIKIEITGTLTISELEVLINANKLDRGTCLNRLVGTNYICNNVGLGSQQTYACEQRFEQDVINIETNTVIILAGINDIYQGVDLSVVQSNLLKMYDKAETYGITVIPCTLLPYSGGNTQNSLDRFKEVNAKILALNSWIRSTASIRRYGLCDWYYAMEDPSKPGYMYSQYTSDGVHLNVAGNAKIVDSFDLSQLSVESHDFYAIPILKIPFEGERNDEYVNFNFGNKNETTYQIRVSSEPNVSLSSNVLLETKDKTAQISFLENGYYKCYGVDTNVWSEEIYLKGKPTPPPKPSAMPARTRIGISGSGISTKSGIRYRI